MTDKIALITGASRGIGREIALTFAKNGYKVAVNYNNSEQQAFEIVHDIRQYNSNCIAVKADVSDRQQVENMFAVIKEQLGAVDILINNAGIAQQKLFTDITEAEWDKMFDVNVKGAFNCCQAALKTMLQRHSGRIINISSMWGQVGASCEVHYSAAKAAVIGMTKALAKEVGLSGITVNCIAPGVVMTDMCAHLSEEDIAALKDETPMNEVIYPQDIAAAALFLAGDGARLITGQILGVNGGLAI